MAYFRKMVEGSGHVITETRPVPEFHALTFGIGGTLLLDQGESERLVVEGEDNILAEIKTEVEDGRLTITVRDGRIQVHPTQPLIYRLTVRALDEIVLSGPGRIEAEPLTLTQIAVGVNGSGEVKLAQLTAEKATIRDNGSGTIVVARLEASTLEVAITGSGSVTVAGQATRQAVSLSGSGRYAAAGLFTQDAQARLSGSGSATLRVETSLVAQLTGGGSIVYIGDPIVTQQCTGSGRVQQQALPSGTADGQLPAGDAND